MVQLWLNGELIKEVQQENITNFGPTRMTIGNSTHVVTERFKGSIGEMRIYNRALSVDEIQKIYKYYNV